MSQNMADQTERAFQQQQGVFAFAKGRGKGKKSATKRFVRNVGLGFKTPKEASEGTYVDKHCPFTGTVSVRGRVLKGLVHRCKMNKTIIVRRDYLHYVSKYNRYEKRHKNIPAHLSPCFRVANGDQVTIGQTRPIAKTVQFTVLDVSAGRETKLKGFAKF